MVNWSVSSQIAFIICYILFSIFVSNVCFVTPEWPLIRRGRCCRNSYNSEIVFILGRNRGLDVL